MVPSPLKIPSHIKLRRTAARRLLDVVISRLDMARTALPSPSPHPCARAMLPLPPEPPVCPASEKVALLTEGCRWRNPFAGEHRKDNSAGASGPWAHPGNPVE